MGRVKQNASSVSSHIRFGRRTYFFDVTTTKDNKKYLRITESKFVEEGEPRLYNSFILFPENLVDFQKSVAEAASQLG